MERNEIIKALECCSNNDECVGEACPYYATGCEKSMPKDALSLINELTEEIRILEKIVEERGAEVIRHDKCIRTLHTDIAILEEEKKQLTDENESLTETVKVRGETIEKLQFDVTDISEDNRKLTEENERLRGCVKSKEEVEAIMRATYEPLVKEILKEQIDKATADIVRKMQERLVKSLTPYINISKDEKLSVLMWCLELVDQIAEEMIKGGETIE